MLSSRYGRAFERVVALGIGVGSLPIETDFKTRSLLDPTVERGTLMGAIQELPHCTRCPGQRTHPLRKPLTRRSRSDAVAHAAGRRERHGLDVRQLFDTAQRGALIGGTLPRRHEARLRRALPRRRRQRPSARSTSTASPTTAKTRRRRARQMRESEMVTGAVVRKLRLKTTDAMRMFRRTAW